MTHLQLEVSRWAFASAMGAALACLGAVPAFADPCNAPLPNRGQVFSGPVRYVGDGDSLCVEAPSTLQKMQTAPGGRWVEVRLADFYAVELHEPGGREAKATLTSIAMGRTVVCTAGKRSYDRVVARCTLNGVSLGERMRRAGVKEGGNGR